MGKTIYKDVTNQVEIDHDFMRISIMKCTCGKEFGYWDFRIGIEAFNKLEGYPKECKCGRKFLFKEPIIRVYEVLEDFNAKA